MLTYGIEILLKCCNGYVLWCYTLTLNRNHPSGVFSCKLLYEFLSWSSRLCLHKCKRRRSLLKALVVMHFSVLKMRRYHPVAFFTCPLKNLGKCERLFSPHIPTLCCPLLVSAPNAFSSISIIGVAD